MARGHPAGTSLRRWFSTAGFRSVKLTGLGPPPLARVDAAVMAVQTAKPASLARLDTLRAHDPAVRTLVITERGDAEAARVALGRGASFVLVWPTTAPEVLLCVAELMRQAGRQREQLARFVRIERSDHDAARRGTATFADAWRLTPCERRVLPHAVIGEAYKDIAVWLKLSPRMVRFHADNIRKKAGGLGWAEIRAEWFRQAGGR